VSTFPSTSTGGITAEPAPAARIWRNSRGGSPPWIQPPRAMSIALLRSYSLARPMSHPTGGSSTC